MFPQRNNSNSNNNNNSSSGNNKSVEGNSSENSPADGSDGLQSVFREGSARGPGLAAAEPPPVCPSPLPGALPGRAGAGAIRRVAGWGPLKPLFVLGLAKPLGAAGPRCSPAAGARGGRAARDPAAFLTAPFSLLSPSPLPVSSPAAARGLFAASGSRREEAEGPDGLAPAGLGSGTEPLRAAPPPRRRSPPAPPCAMSERARPGPGAHPGAGYGEPAPLPPARTDAPRERGQSALRARVLPASSAAGTSRALFPVPFPHLQ